jgi:hypothetical protein
MNLIKMDIETEQNEAYEVAKVMEKYGGSFVQNLAKMIQSADINNIRKCKSTWSDYWNEYKQVAEKEKLKDSDF